MPKVNKRWLGIILILLSIIGVVVWATAATGDKLTLAGNVLLQLFLIAIGSVGSFLEGEVTNDRRLKLHARERYNRLHTLAESADEVLKYLRDVLKNVSSDRDESPIFLAQINEKKVAASLQAFYYMGGRISQWEKEIADCLDFWNRFAHEEVGQRHKNYLERSKEK